jgi:hypothetical protein
MNRRSVTRKNELSRPTKDAPDDEIFNVVSGSETMATGVVDVVCGPPVNTVRAEHTTHHDFTGVVVAGIALSPSLNATAPGEAFASTRPIATRALLQRSKNPLRKAAQPATFR